MISKIICWFIGHEAFPIIMGNAIQNHVRCKRCFEPVELIITKVDLEGGINIIEYRIKR